MTFRLAHRLPLLLTSVALLASLAACGETGVKPINVPAPTGSATTAPTQEPGSPTRVPVSAMEMIRVEATGGMCAGGDGEGTGCGSTTVISGDGSWEVTDESGTRTGRLDFDGLNRLNRLTHSDDVRANPKDEQSCDSWVDGRDVALTFETYEGQVDVSSCDYDLSDSRLLAFVVKATA